MPTWVVKVGSSLLTSGGRGLDDGYIGSLIAQLVVLIRQGYRIALVTSGAIAEGRIALSFHPDSLGEMQAAAAVGQTRLMYAVSRHFASAGIVTGQILLTHDDIKERQRYLNARSTLNHLFTLGAVPVINENDTVSTAEIRFGNNDIIGGLIANLIDAERLIILTDVAGLYTANPQLHPTAELIAERNCADPELDAMAGGSLSGLGCGGMATKLQSARLAARSGTDSWIVAGANPAVIGRIAAGDQVGTRLLARKKHLASRLRWLAGRQRVEGALQLDDGAVTALVSANKSLLPVGVTGVDGSFSRGALVNCTTPDGVPIARGLANYDSQTIEKICGHTSKAITTMLGEPHDHEVIHRDNLVLL